MRIAGGRIEDAPAPPVGRILDAVPQRWQP
jgi:hypothetical protein